MLKQSSCRYSLDQELACDAQVLTRYPGKRRSYATAMLKTQCGADGVPVACQWAAPHALTQRVAALLDPAVEVPRTRWNVRIVLLLAAMVSAACWAFQPAQFQGMRMRDSSLDFKTLPPPEYPPYAIAADIAGFVELQIAVSADGTPDHIAIVRSMPAGVFDQAVLDAARNWRFMPALMDGKAVASNVRVPVTFELDPAKPATEGDGSDADASGTRQTAAQSERVASCATAGCAKRGVLQ